jgi:hypothetical protein
MFTFQFFRCPKCHKYLFFRIMKYFELIKGNSGLGPSMISCSTCGTIIPTGNVEWPNMTVQLKIYLWFITMVYVFILGLFLSLATLGIAETVLGIEQNTLLTAANVLSISIIVGMPFILLQCLRIESSKKRTRENTNEPYTASFFDLNTNFQSLGMAVIMLWMIVIFVLFALQ